MADREFSYLGPVAGASRPAGLRRRKISSHPEVSAAFFTFHRNAANAANTESRAWLPPFLSGGGWAFFGLAVMGFAGGLSLALLSFNTPEHPITITGHAPEMLYAKPLASQPDVLIAANSAAVTTDTTAAHPPSAAPVMPADDENAPEPRRSFADEVDRAAELALTASSAEAPLPPATPNLAAAIRLGAAGGGQLQTHGGGLNSGYDAVELPSVPEPANGFLVALCLATIIGCTHVARRRCSHS